MAERQRACKIKMSITVNIYYTGKSGSALEFAKEMERSGIADRIRAEKGNLRYEYFIPLDSSDTVLLIDCWENQQALDIHHSSPMMKEIALLREKYDLHMRVERFVSDESETDSEFIRK
jgi:quinol monooxygenase YgiN